MVRRSSQTGIEQSLALAPTGVKAAVTHIDKIRQGREVSIEIHHHYASKVFHPGSVVSGDLIITPLRDVQDVSMQISLIGRSRVHREDVQGRQTTTHNFLGLDMPIPPSAYPPSGNMQKGQTYRIPFNFTVPSQLLPSACRRRSEFDGISDYHVQLPPSVGGWEKDDLAPELSRITYAITASVHQGDSLKKVMEISKTIKMLGSSREDPPLSITKNDENYKLKKTKKVRNGLLSKAVGRITAMADQPTAFYLYSDGREASQSEANVNLFFEGANSKIAPPEVEAVSAKIRAYTWYSGTPMQTLPNFGVGRGAFSMTVPVTAERIETPWVSNLDKLGELRDVKQTAAAQTKAVNVRFSLPVSKKTFLPTFHSCLISRAYVMELKLKVGGQNMTLSLPVQIVTGDCVVAKDELDILPQFEDL